MATSAMSATSPFLVQRVSVPITKERLVLCVWFLYVCVWSVLSVWFFLLQRIERFVPVVQVFGPSFL